MRVSQEDTAVLYSPCSDRVSAYINRNTRVVAFWLKSGQHVVQGCNGDYAIRKRAADSVGVS